MKLSTTDTLQLSSSLHSLPTQQFNFKLQDIGDQSAVPTPSTSGKITLSYA